MIWLLRMRRWVQRPPSWRMVKFVTAIVLAMIAVATYEYFFGWPEWLTVNEHRGRIPRGF